MKVAPFAEIPGDSWDTVCAGSGQAWLFHRAAWVALEGRHFVRENLSFGLVGRSGLAAIQPLYLSDAGTGAGPERLLHSGIHRHTGLAVAAGTSDADVNAARSLAMRRIEELAEEHDVDRIQLNSHNLAPENLSAERREIPFWVEDHGFYLGLHFGEGGMLPAPAMATCNADQIVDLGPGEEQLFAGLEESCRRAVRKATGHGLAFDPGSGAAAVEAYVALARRAAVRTGESLPPERYYHDVWEALGPSGSCAILIARHEGTAIAGLVLALDKGSAGYLAGASDPDRLPLRAADFLHWSAILWAKRRGLGHYRLGPWFPEVPSEWPIARVSRFKRKFGGRSWSVIQGSRFRRPQGYVEAAHRHLDTLATP
jgi:hypothetical protein